MPTAQGAQKQKKKKNSFFHVKTLIRDQFYAYSSFIILSPEKHKRNEFG